MATKVVQRTIAFTISDYKSTRPNVGLLPSESEGLRKGQQALRCLALLMGEAEPSISPLPASYLLTSDAGVYRYDWVFGIGCLAKDTYWWDWQNALREDCAVVVQLLIDTPGGFGFAEVSTALLGLQPSKDSRSWLDAHGEQLEQALNTLAGPAEKAVAGAQPAIGVATGAALRAGAAISNFVRSVDAGKKNWYTYRFLDGERQCCAVEWKINKAVMLQFGPMLRGSLCLTFHGGPLQDAGRADGITIEMRPQLGFFPDDILVMVRPTLLPDKRVELAIVPREPPRVQT
jgi:hypothetical protein